jgi:hypothetical protein
VPTQTTTLCPSWRPCSVAAESAGPRPVRGRDSETAFPGRIMRALLPWRLNLPTTTITNSAGYRGGADNRRVPTIFQILPFAFEST